LVENADRYGFRMSFPRNNRHGIAYEPWHWCCVNG
jgi:D-alanyl-D-alanine carboxypeptidase